MAGSLNKDIMQSFWLHKWARTPKSDPSSVGITVWGYCHIPMDSISMCSNTLFMSNMDVQEAVWVGCQPQPWHDDIILTPQVRQKLCKCLMWMGKQFDVAVSLNHDIMTSFWLNKWARTPTSDTISVGITVWGYCHMPMDSISMCLNTLLMSNVDAESGLMWLSASTMI